MSPELAWFLIGLGVVLFLLTLGLAFTIYGLVAAFLGVISIATGAWLLAHGTPKGASRG